MKHFYISNVFLCYMLTCCNDSPFQLIQLFANMRKYHLKLFNPFNIANSNINSTSKVKRKLD